MNILIFAGGAGTRLWPLSRNQTPKQFGILKDNQSTLQMAVDRVRSFGMDKIFIATNERYVKIVQEQIPDLSSDHILTEPARRDLAAAVGLALLRLKQQGVTGTIAMLWADHFMDLPEAFVAALKRGEELLAEQNDRFIFLGEKARFANHNLGWIRLGTAQRDNEYAFVEWKYRPDLESCKKMFNSHEWVWNPGYFIFDIDFVLSLYEQHQTELHGALVAMLSNATKLQEEYALLPVLSFDNAIVEHIKPEQAVVLKVNLGWSDPGTLYALKEALTAKEDDNFIHGHAIVEKTRDSFVYNEEPHKLVTTVGLDGVIVINTKDSILVCHKDSVPDIKELLKKLEAEGKAEYL